MTAPPAFFSSGRSIRPGGLVRRGPDGTGMVVRGGSGRCRRRRMAGVSPRPPCVSPESNVREAAERESGFRAVPLCGAESESVARTCRYPRFRDSVSPGKGARNLPFVHVSKYGAVARRKSRKRACAPRPRLAPGLVCFSKRLPVRVNGANRPPRATNPRLSYFTNPRAKSMPSAGTGRANVRISGLSRAPSQRDETVRPRLDLPAIPPPRPEGGRMPCRVRWAASRPKRPARVKRTPRHAQN